MKLKELRAGQGSVNVEAVVKSKAEPRVMNKYGKDLKVANAVVMDDSGEMKLTLWNADVDKVNVGNKVKIINGYVSEFNGEKQLTSGKFGKLEVVDTQASNDESNDSEKSQAKKAEEKEEVSEEVEDEEDFEEKEF